MDYEILIEDEAQFWEELDDVLSTPCRSHDRIDDTLRTWLGLTTRYRDQYLPTEDDISRCSLNLLESDLYVKHTDYVRRQLIYGLLQEDDAPTLHVVAAFLLFDGKHDEKTFQLMSKEGSFPRLVELIRTGTDDELGLHRLLLELLYEMSRIQRLSWDDLTIVDDAFILYLFQIIESLSNDVGDPYHYPVIRVLLVLNEQYMVFAHDPLLSRANGVPITNRVIKTLSVHGGAYKTFGENIILLINRESETSLQLLILKLLYLLFTTPTTQEYFYTNDLHVLVDILIRNLLDLPADAVPLSPATGRPSTTGSLRHTYLRVLHPLLAHTQLRHPPHYKRDQLQKALFLLADAGNNHFDRPDETTVRLVGRCVSVEWLRDEEELAAAMLDDAAAYGPADDRQSEGPGRGGRRSSGGLGGADGAVRAGQAAVAKKLLGMGLPEALESSLSIAEVAAQVEKPGVLTPSRRDRERERWPREGNGDGAGAAEVADGSRDEGNGDANGEGVGEGSAVGSNPFDDGSGS